MKPKIFLFVFVLTLTIAAQQWHGFYNRIPNWPNDINTTNIENFIAELNQLRQEVQDGMPNYTANYENLSQAEAMKIAMEYQKSAMNMSAAEMARRAEQNQYSTDVELPEEIELNSRLASVKNEFDQKLHSEIDKLKQTYKCDPGLGDTGCDVLSAELKKLSEKLSVEYFTGNQAKIILITDEVNDYMIKKKLPLQVQKEKDQFKLMGDNVTGDYSAFQMVDACLQTLLSAAERMEWLARLKDDGNVFYSPGQQY